MRLLVFLYFLIVCSNDFAISQPMPLETIQAQPQIRVAFHPQITGDQDILKELFAEELKKITHLNIKAYMPKSYSDVVELMKTQKVDFAFLSGFSYVATAKKVELRILLKTVFDGEDSYRSVFVVRNDKTYNKIEDLKGKQFAFGDKLSTSGFLLPYATLLKKGINPQKFFKNIVYSGQHKKSFEMLISGEVDGVASWAKMKNGEGYWTEFMSKEDQAKIKPILYTEPAPNEIFCVTEDFFSRYQKETMKIVAALLSYINKPEDRNLVDQLFRMDYFVPAYNSDFTRLRELVKLVEQSMH